VNAEVSGGSHEVPDLLTTISEHRLCCIAWRSRSGRRSRVPRGALLLTLCERQPQTGDSSATRLSQRNDRGTLIAGCGGFPIVAHAAAMPRLLLAELAGQKRHCSTRSLATPRHGSGFVTGVARVGASNSSPWGFGVVSSALRDRLR
jgi:hypothetical protein